MFDKKLLMSHIENETNNDKMMRAGVSTPFYGNIEEKKVSAPEGFHFMKHGEGKYKLMKNPEGGFKPHKGGSEEAEFPIQKVHEEKNCGCGQDPCKTYGKKNVEEQAEPTKLQIIMRSLSGRGSESGEKTPGRGAEPTDHHEVGGKPRNVDSRKMIAARYKSMKGYDPEARRADAIKSLKVDRQDYI